MKKLLYSFCALLLLITMSCDSDKEEFDLNIKTATLLPAQVTGHWQLKKVIWRTQIAGQPDTSIPVPYEEVIQVKADSSFTRYRNNEATTGTFTIKKIKGDAGEEWGVLATFHDPAKAYHQLLSSTIIYPYSKGQVYLWAGDADYLIEDYAASDGPTFYYQKIEE